MSKTGPMLPFGEDTDPPPRGGPADDAASELRGLAAEMRYIRNCLGAGCKAPRAARLRLSHCRRRAERLAGELLKRGLLP